MSIVRHRSVDGVDVTSGIVKFRVSVDGERASPRVTIQASVAAPVRVMVALSPGAETTHATLVAGQATAYTVITGQQIDHQADFTSGMDGSVAHKVAEFLTNGAGLLVIDLTWTQVDAPDRVNVWVGSTSFGVPALITRYNRASFNMTASEPLAVSTGGTLIVRVDGTPRTVTFTAATPNEMTVAEYMTAVLTQLADYVNAFDSGFGLVYGVTYTATSEFTVTGGSAKTALGF